jgi:hypothetical protein
MQDVFIQMVLVQSFHAQTLTIKHVLQCVYLMDQVVNNIHLVHSLQLKIVLQDPFVQLEDKIVFLLHVIN